MNKTVILTIAVLTGLMILGFNFHEVLSAEPTPSGPVPVPYPATTKAIPDWVDNNFRWYVEGQIDEKTLLTSMNWMFDNNVMHLSEKAAQDVHDLRAQVAEQQAAISSLRTLVSSQAMDSGSGTGGDVNIKAGDATGYDAEPYVPGGSVVSVAVSGIAAVDVPSESGTQKVLVVGGENTDVNALVQWVLRESYLEDTKDLYQYAEKVRYYNNMKEAIRDAISERSSTMQTPKTDFATAITSVPITSEMLMTGQPKRWHSPTAR